MSALGVSRSLQGVASADYIIKQGVSTAVEVVEIVYETDRRIGEKRNIEGAVNTKAPGEITSDKIRNSIERNRQNTCNYCTFLFKYIYIHSYLYMYIKIYIYIANIYNYLVYISIYLLIKR